MATQTVPIDGLAAAIMRELELYTDAVEEGVREAIFTTAAETAALLRATSPKGTPVVHGYAKGWTVKKVEGANFTQAIVHAGKNYPMVHLLEKGHAKRDGGRVAPVVHVAPAEAAALVRLEKRIKDVVEGA